MHILDEIRLSLEDLSAYADLLECADVEKDLRPETLVTVGRTLQAIATNIQLNVDELYQKTKNGGQA